MSTSELGFLTPKLQGHSAYVPTLSSAVWPLQFLRAEAWRVHRKALRYRRIRGTTGPDSTQQGYQSCVKTILHSFIVHPFRFTLLHSIICFSLLIKIIIKTDLQEQAEQTSRVTHTQRKSTQIIFRD